MKDLSKIAWSGSKIYISATNNNKEEIIILKLDIEKSFDKVEHNTILQILGAKGFGTKWINYAIMIQPSSTSYVMLNVVPKKKIIASQAG